MLNNIQTLSYLNWSQRNTNNLHIYNADNNAYVL